MVDLLSLLRLYNVNNKAILEHDTKIEKSHLVLRGPKNVKTNYLLISKVQVQSQRVNIMAEALSLLRHYNIHKKEIVESDDQIIFGECRRPKNTETGYLIYGSGKNGVPKQYYTLECLLFFAKNIQLPHPQYVHLAVEANIPVVRRPDRKDLVAYLTGETNTSPSIDKSAPSEVERAVDHMRKLCVR